MPLNVGEKIGPYEILGLAGTGGYGEVYRARDTRLDRIVAIKFMRHDLARRDDLRQRFHQEARAISSLNHPNICSLYDVGEANGLDYLVMEYVPGETLAQRLKRGPLPVETVIRYGAEILSALAAAHSRGIIHRDLKPGNIMITDSGVKVLDFGLAKRTNTATAVDSAAVTLESETGAGQVLGTVAYLSPEQAEGRPLDPRSDIFAFGIVLYEALSGTQPFHGDSTLSTVASILRDDPASLRQLRPDVPEKLDHIVRRCLAKKPEQRYDSAASIISDLDVLKAPKGQVSKPRRFVVIAAAVVAVAVVGTAVSRAYVQSTRARWATNEAVPQVAQLIQHSESLAALKLLRQAEQFAPASPELIRLKEELPVSPVTIQTNPPDAEIFATDYTNPRAADLSHWERLGISPVTTDTLPRGSYRIRAAKEGFQPTEVMVFSTGNGNKYQLELHTTKDTPTDMAWIPPFPVVFLTLIGYQSPVPQMPAFWMDKYEVTNRQFKAFVDAGGYQKREYWKEHFIKDQKEVSWEQAMSSFRDATGRAGPSTWEGGTYPDGKADFPVSGVSWYEASAFAEFAGKTLPTLYHWNVAAGAGRDAQITTLSNFANQGPARVGTFQGVAPFGTYDMAGNVKEWVINQSDDKRYILGGSSNESSYMFQLPDARDPFERSATFGFRCMRYLAPLPSSFLEKVNGPVISFSRDRTHDQPADDRSFQVFTSLLSYDKTDLKATSESTTDAPHWRQEKISFQAAYGKERVILHLYLPKSATPPYQALFYFPGANILAARNPEEVTTRLMEYIVKSGRAIVFPAYSGTLERGPTPLDLPPARRRDGQIQQVKDVARTIDYLQTRSDIDMTKLGYYGFSLGAQEGLIVLGAEPRLKAAVLVSVGTSRRDLPEVDTWNYAPRIKVPVLMLNGHDDWLFPAEVSQVPMFKALGTPEKDKKYVVYPGGHADFIDRMDVIKEALNWLDRYLGPVNAKQ